MQIALRFLVDVIEEDESALEQVHFVFVVALQEEPLPSLDKAHLKDLALLFVLHDVDASGLVHALLRATAVVFRILLLLLLDECWRVHQAAGRSLI